MGTVSLVLALHHHYLIKCQTTEAKEFANQTKIWNVTNHDLRNLADEREW